MRMIAAILAALLMLTTVVALAEAPADPEATVEPELGADYIEEVEGNPPKWSETEPAIAYVMVSCLTGEGLLPLPMEGEYIYHLKQVQADGTESENVIHISADSVFMEDSTCENHECVSEGTVSLENRDERILGNMIICLPNQVFLQLMTKEEIIEQYGAGSAGSTGGQ